MLPTIALLGCGGTTTEPTPEPTDVPPAHTAETGSPEPTADTAPPPPPPPRCEPTATPGAPWVVEGEVARWQLACASGEDRARFTVTLVDGPAGATLDTGTWVASLPTGLADSGHHELFVSITAPGGVPENLVLAVDVTEAGPSTAGNTPPDPLVALTEFGLPVLYCEPRAEIVEDYVPSPCTFEGVRYDGASIKIRGAASAGYPKPSFTLDFGDVPLEASALGLRDKHHLVLITTFDDNSYVRQKLIYDQWKDLAAFRALDRPTIDTGYVVLYLNGHYGGLYVASDHVDDEFFGERGLNREGNVYKSVSHDANFKRELSSGLVKRDLSAGWEKKEGLPAGDFADLEALTAWVADTPDPRFAAEAPSWIRVDEFMDWYLLVAFSAAQDSAGKNAYLYDDPAAREFRYVPWDFNHSWGQDWTTARVPVTVFDDYRWNNGIFVHFHDSPPLSEAMWAQWELAAAPGGPFDPAALLARIDGYVAAIDPEARRDWARWQDEYRSYSLWSSRRDFTTYDEELAYVRDWITRRGPAFEAARPHP